MRQDVQAKRFFEIQIEVVGVKEAAEYLGVSTKTIYKMAREGALPHCKLGSRYRFHRSELVKFAKGG